jgi:NAD+ kinase
LFCLKKTPDTIRRIGLVANPEKPVCGPTLRQAADLALAAGRTVLTEPRTAQMVALDAPVCRDLLALAYQTDLLLVFGGDGTMLRIAREVAGLETPILGINVGALGFLTAVPSSQLAAALGQIWAGDFELETRPLIEAAGQMHGAIVTQSALNEFVITRGITSRMIRLDVRVNDQELTHYRCDGLIVSSPTGSTAYSLSAGGAIVSPDAEVFSLTPICPHTLNNRSVIVSLNATVEVRVLSDKVETILTADGQVPVPLAANDIITIRRSPRAICLVHLAGSSFFKTLRQKLNWSGSTVET